MQFRNFMLENEKNMAQGDLQNTLKRVPKAHQKLIKGYTYKTEDGNTLKGDDENIGQNNMHDKEIKVAAPWNYGREFAVLHEIGHTVWAHYIEDNPKLKKRWHDITKNTKDKINQDTEELFCQAYANTYAKNKIEIHNHPQWEKFVKSLKCH